MIVNLEDLCSVENRTGTPLFQQGQENAVYLTTCYKAKIIFGDLHWGNIDFDACSLSTVSTISDVIDSNEQKNHTKRKQIK